MQTDLVSEYGSEFDAKEGVRKPQKTFEQQRIEDIIKDKSKSIADVLLKENFHSYQRNFNAGLLNKLAAPKKRMGDPHAE